MQREFSFPLPNGWFQVAYSDELAVGQLERLSYFGTELILFRGQDGRARVLDAYCPHLGAHIGYGGQVVGNAVRCPFHAWEYDGSGCCTRIPYAKRIPVNARVRSWPVDEKSGLILVYFHKDHADPQFEIPEIPEYHSAEWTDYFRKEFTVRSRNQELAENAVDPAHFKYVHRTAEVPKAEAWTEDHVFRAKLDYPIVMGDDVQYGKVDISAYGFGVGVSRFRGIVDTTVVIGGTPIDDDHVHQRMSFSIKKLDSEEATQGVGRAFVEEISRQFSEDMPIWENKTFWSRPVLCDGDGPIATLRKWGGQFH